MTQTETFVAPGISVIAGKRGGRPCVIGTRLDAEMLHGMWKQGYTGAQLLAMYPELTVHTLWCAVAFWAGVVHGKGG
jgi:uncharacterized protein (DUF433 family)